MLHLSETFDVSRCHGCGLCAMVCPVYQHGGSVMATPHGMAKALTGGGNLSLQHAQACLLCGACAPHCPQDIDLMQMMVELRITDGDTLMPIQQSVMKQKSKTVLILDQSMVEDNDIVEYVLSMLGGKAQLASDQGADISKAMAQGQPVDSMRIHQFISSLQSARRIVITDGLLQQLITHWLPQVSMQSLGEVLLTHTEVKKRLEPDDCLVMDSQSYHASFSYSVTFYDDLQRETGCHLSRDLHRLAIPTGAKSINGFDVERQIKWLLRGRNVSRLVVESWIDFKVLVKHQSVPVIHITELLS